MTEENGDTDASMPPTGAGPSDSNTQGYSNAPEELADWPIDDLDDWPFDDPSVDVARLRESLREADADIAAGRTFGEDEIRARYGLPRSEVEVIRSEAEPDPDDLDVGYAQLASEFSSETADDERRAARDRYAGRPERA